jgi:hypothetical protein
MPAPPLPDRPPDLMKVEGNSLVKFWLEPGHFQAQCWSTSFWLDHHPSFPPESQYNLEIEGVTYDGGLFHYLGEGFPEEIDADLFVEKVLDVLPDLRQERKLN